MIAEIITLVTYLCSLAMVMYGLSSINFDTWIRPNHVPQFYFFYVALVLALTHLVAQCLLTIMSIRIGDWL